MGCSPSALTASPRSLHLPRATDVAAARHAILREALSLFGRRPGAAAGGGSCVAVAAQHRPPVPSRAGRARSQARLEKGRWLRVTSGPGVEQTDFPGVIFHLQGFS